MCFFPNFVKCIYRLFIRIRNILTEYLNSSLIFIKVQTISSTYVNQVGNHCPYDFRASESIKSIMNSSS
nr:MAG TPA: hypothetical protein [Caudoviricetes sp.]